MRECILCGSREPFATVYARDGWTLVRCAHCALVFLHPQPDAERMRAAYYHDAAFAAALTGDLRATTLARAREKLALLAGAGVSPAGARLLDVGAASGAWLELAAAEGARSAAGVEIGSHAAAAARARGLDVRVGTLADQELPARGFDLITFWDVLEHLPDPRAELRIARGLLAPGGLLAATFPNVGGLYPRLTYRLLARRTGVWEYPELPVHFYDFSPATAWALFARAGLAVRAHTTYATPYEHYRQTSLSPQRVPSRKLRLAFGLLHHLAYPVAARTGRGNAQFFIARG